jgi:hypothetical protein
MHKFADDVEFLARHGSIELLESPGGGRVAVSGKYQARVMTSAVEPGGESLGYINRKFIEQGKTGTPFDNYGGEDRFWLGPEAGQFGLYFPAGKSFEFANWQTPAAFQEGEWSTKGAAESSRITFVRSMTLSNYSGAEFKLDVERTIRALDAQELKPALGEELAPAVKWVGFATENNITNRGSKPWKEDQGLISVWILGMFNPAPGTVAIAPFEKNASGPIVNDRYFGKIGSDRLLIDEQKGVVLFKADGEFRSKIGLGAARAKPVLGSYSPAAGLLTIVRFTLTKTAKRYVNNLWETHKEPYGGDVSNVYNDGPVAPGAPPLGGFYEIESSSAAAALAPGASLSHRHETWHFVGSRTELEPIAVKLLGVSLADVERAGL